METELARSSAFTEAFYAAVMRRSGHFLVSKQVAWAVRDELVTLLRIESHTGITRTERGRLKRPPP